MGFLIFLVCIIIFNLILIYNYLCYYDYFISLKSTLTLPINDILAKENIEDPIIQIKRSREYLDYLKDDINSGDQMCNLMFTVLGASSFFVFFSKPMIMWWVLLKYWI